MADSVPIYVIGTAAVSAMMVATSVAISLTTEGDVADLLYLDCLATQNLGHAAFLVGFATSCWRGGHVLGRCFVVTAPWLLAAHGAASLAAAARGRSSSRSSPVARAAAAAPSLAAVAAGPASGSRAAAATRAAAIGVSLAYAFAALRVALARDAQQRRRATALPEPALYAAALPEPALYAEGYTLAFHVAFVSAVGLARADALDAAPPHAVIYGAGFVSERDDGRDARRAARRRCRGPAGRADRGVNFAIHGAGIFVFNAYLMFSDARAFPRLRAISVFACFAGGGAGAGSAGRPASRPAGGAAAPAAAAASSPRARPSAPRSASRARLPRDAHNRVAPPEKAPDREAPGPRTRAVPPRRAVRHQRSHFASLLSPTGACFLAFAAFAFLRRSSPDAHAPRRVLETPHAYLLGFHFVFILSGFAAPPPDAGVVASLRVASAFLAAAGVVAAAQLVLAPPALVAALAACVAAGERLRALVEDALGDAGAAGRWRRATRRTFGNAPGELRVELGDALPDVALRAAADDARVVEREARQRPRGDDEVAQGRQGRVERVDLAPRSAISSSSKASRGGRVGALLAIEHRERRAGVEEERLGPQEARLGVRRPARGGGVWNAATPSFTPSSSTSPTASKTAENLGRMASCSPTRRAEPRSPDRV
ncbi:high-affinity potassium ion transmembrane transporter [Aureococcus anophagefferens]|uniref:High-affinity potassium ion transmembrane transporter n=1 Tax=Aureococcus anophagefferens TaxID=44056 RepID=A0ABR1GAY3_AURAN